MKIKMVKAFMETAVIFSKLSHAVRLQVGAITVKDDRIISIGYNGMPSGWDNECEHEVDGRLVTRPEVLHAESNAIAKLARSSEAGQGSTLFVTHAPCLDCAKAIHQAGITAVYYKNDYRSYDGIVFLNECYIAVEKV